MDAKRFFLILALLVVTSSAHLATSAGETKVSTAVTTGTTTRASVASDGTEGSDHSFNFYAYAGSFISADGRYVAFRSGANNLVSSDTNYGWDIFVHDQQTGQTTRVSIASNGTQGNRSSQDPSISADGRYVAFASEASNLVSGDTNICFGAPTPGRCPDIFVHDRQTGQTTRVSVSSSGAQGNDRSAGPSVSADGRYVAFQSNAGNLVSGDTNICLGDPTPGTCPDIFVHDRQTGQTTRVSVASDGTEGNEQSTNPSISADGRYVAFQSRASNLVSGDTNYGSDIFVHDRQTGQTTRVSVDSNGIQANNGALTPSISADGRYVAFISISSNLVSGDTNGWADTFVHDRQTRQTTRVSVASDGTEGDGGGSYEILSISANGRYVAFASAANNLISGDTNGSADIFVHDRQTRQTTLVSVASDGTQGNWPSFFPSISADGRYVAFQSEASNLVNGDTNQAWDIFVHNRLPGSVSYSVSGQVRDTNNSPITGVRVSTSSGNTAVTDSNGNYTITGLITGTYTITPTKTGYTFMPQTGTVSVPPDVTGQDFVGCPYYTIDSDRDGLVDGWEICGYDADGDGNPDVDLPAMGADPHRKDIFVEIDYMVCIPPDCTPAHSHRPNTAAISRTVQAFANAPELGPITLHVDFGPLTVMNPTTGTLWGTRSQSDPIPHENQLEPPDGSWDPVTGWQEFDRIKRMHFDPDREKIFHYALFVHELGGGLATSYVGWSRIITTSVETARRGASDFVVALGGAEGGGNETEQAGVFMHELGHNLGLLHSGDGNGCGGNECSYEPNYLSVMNYLFMQSGLMWTDGSTGHINYSGLSNIPALDEQHLNETVGIPGAGIYGTRYHCRPLGQEDWPWVQNADGPINWDCIGFAGGTDVQTDINADHLYSTLTSFNDWAALTFTGGKIGVDGGAYVPSSTNEQTTDTVVPSGEPTWDELSQLYRPYSINFSDGSELVASLGATDTVLVTVTNTGALTAMVTLSATSINGWFDTSSVPTSVTMVPSASLSMPITYSVPSNRSGAIDDTLSIEAVPQESPLMGDSKRFDVHIGPLTWFEADPVFGTVPLSVTFTDYSVGVITSRVWSFGDGSTSTVINPTYVYTQAGEYTVTLTVTGPDGVDEAFTRISVSKRKIYLPIILRNH